MSTTRDPLERVQAIREDRKSSRRRFLGTAASAAVLGGLKLSTAQVAAAQEFRPNTIKPYYFNRTISFQDMGKADPYEASYIDVSGLRGTVEDISILLGGLTHTNIRDLDVLLRTPTGRYLMLISDVGSAVGKTPVTGLNLAFTTSAPNLLPATGTIQPGPYQATDYDPSNNSMPFPAQPPNVTTVGQLTGLSAAQATGRWFLYIYDKVNGDGGSLQNWGIEFVTSNRGPVAPNLTYSVRQGATLRVPRSQVLNRVRDADDDRLVFTPINERSRLGRLTMKQNGSFTFQARPNRTGRDRYRYYVTDGEVVASGRIIIQVTPRPKRNRDRDED